MFNRTPTGTEEVEQKENGIPCHRVFHLFIWQKSGATLVFTYHKFLIIELEVSETSLVTSKKLPLLIT